MQIAALDLAQVRSGAVGPSRECRLWIRFEPARGTIVDCSGAALALLGYAADELRAKPLRWLADVGEWDDDHGGWRALMRGESTGPHLLRLVDVRGKRHPTSACATVFPATGELPAMGLLLVETLDERWPREAAHERDRRRLQSLAYEVTLAEARERERLANELHDGLGQLLAIAQIRLAELAADDRPAPGTCDELRDLLAEAARAARSATFDLHSPLLQQLGLQAAIESLGERLARQAHLAVAVHGRIGDLPLERAVQAVVLRVVRELLANVRKHAGARAVTIELADSDAGLSITVTDDGDGFDPSARGGMWGPDGGFGLFSAEAQMQAIGGRLELRASPGSGTTGRVVVPWPEVRAAAPRRRFDN